MNVPKVFESEYRFCLILWENEPISRAELAQLCAKQLDWAKTTTYTVIHKLAERGILKTDGRIVHSLFTKEQVQDAQMEELMHKTFQSSVPAFISAFCRSREMSPEDVAAMEKLIEKYGE